MIYKAPKSQKESGRKIMQFCRSVAGNYWMQVMWP